MKLLQGVPEGQGWLTLPLAKVIYSMEC